MPRQVIWLETLASHKDACLKMLQRDDIGDLAKDALMERIIGSGDEAKWFGDGERKRLPSRTPPRSEAMTQPGTRTRPSRAARPPHAPSPRPPEAESGQAERRVPGRW